MIDRSSAEVQNFPKTAFFDFPEIFEDACDHDLLAILRRILFNDISFERKTKPEHAVYIPRVGCHMDVLETLQESFLENSN